jgi:tetratricopeptide (TPR) repeat protein
MKNSLIESTDQIVDSLIALGFANYPPNQFEPQEQFNQRFRSVMHKKMEDFQKNLRKGYELMIRELAERDPKNIESYKIKEERLSALNNQDKINKLSKEQGTFQELLGYSPEMMTTMYEVAIDLYNKSRYEDSILALTFLTTLNAYCPYFWIAMGCAYEKRKDFDGAIMGYKLAVFCAPGTLEPYTYLGRCCLSCNKIPEAIEVYNVGIALARDNPGDEKLQALQTKLEQMIDYMMKKDASGGV